MNSIKDPFYDYEIYKAHKYLNSDETVKNAMFIPTFNYIYAFEMSNDTVKIGITRNVRHRARMVASNSGLYVLRIYHTAKVQIDVARKIERQCHLAFSAFRTNGEFFQIKFEDACAKLDKYADFIAEDNRKLHEEVIPACRKKYEDYIRKLLYNEVQQNIKEHGNINNPVSVNQSYYVPGFENTMAVSTVIDSDTWVKVKTAEILIEAASLVSGRDCEKLIAKASVLLTGKDLTIDDSGKLAIRV